MKLQTDCNKYTKKKEKLTMTRAFRKSKKTNAHFIDR